MDQAIIHPMSKLSPIESEFATTEAATAHDQWFRKKVRASLADGRDPVPHDGVMADVEDIIAKAERARDASQ
jgi:hypothetical protein